MAARPHTFSFNLFELFTLLVTVLAVSFLVFLCGLYVGEKVQERRSVQKERTVHLPVTVVPEADEGKPKGPDLSLLTEFPTPETKLSEASVSSRRLTAVSPPVKSAVAKSRSVEGLWSVQVEATRNEAAAGAVAQRLRADGYEAYIVRVEKQGEAWYRVRVGWFASLTEASSTAARLRRERKATQAFVVSE